MGKINKLQYLFQNSFKVNDNETTYWDQFCNFKCINGGSEGICKTDPLEVKRTCSPGDENSKVLVIGEAPSSGKGSKKRVGARTSKLFANISNDNESPQHLLSEFVFKQFGSIPYFTDYIKCGVLSQKNDKNKLIIRKEPCFNKFLIEEIRIIQPEYILVCEKNAFWFLVSKLNQILDVLNSLQLIHIYHYTTNQHWYKLLNEFSRQETESMDSIKKRVWEMQIEGEKTEKLKYYRYRRIIVQNGKINIDCSSNSSRRKIEKVIHNT